MTRAKERAIGVSISLYSIISSVALSLLKLLAGFFGHSSALVSDGFNSLGDVISYTVVAGGVVGSEKKADTNHQYGHEKLESIVSIFIALAILATGLGVGYRGILHIFEPQSLVKPTLLPIGAALISIAVKIVLYIYSHKAAQMTQLTSLKALATDHFSDILASSGALVGSSLAYLGYVVFDPIASVIIAFLIIKSSIEVFRAAFDVLMDVSVDKETHKKLTQVILENPHVLQLDVLRTRRVGSGYWVDVEICCCKDLTLYEAHEIAQHVHDDIEHKFPQVRHVMVHVNPCDSSKQK